MTTNSLLQALNDVKAFRAAADMPNPDKASWGGDRDAELARQLIVEEFNEVMEALEKRDIVALGGELADLIYVALFAAAVFGIPLHRVWDEIQAANMRKVDPETGKLQRREDGKILKPEGWYPADIKKAVLGD